MGLFNKKPKVEQCAMCDAAVEPDDRWSHELSHVSLITADAPAWLPPQLRNVAQGEYTFKCDRCDSYPSLKWPKEGGASSAMQLHLGKAHGRGPMANMGVPVGFDMIKIV